MTIQKLMEQIYETKPNGFAEQRLTDWLNEIESMIYTRILERAKDGPAESVKAYDYPADAEQELLLPLPYTGIYLYYIYAQIDFANGDMNRYNNDVAMYNALYKDFADCYLHNHPHQDMPKIDLSGVM